MLGFEFSRPWTVVVPPVLSADASTGKFCRWLGPLSVSPGSLGVIPGVKSGIGDRSIARPPLL